MPPMLAGRAANSRENPQFQSQAVPQGILKSFTLGISLIDSVLTFWSLSGKNFAFLMRHLSINRFFLTTVCFI